MAQAPLPDAVAVEALELVKQYGSVRNAARQTGINRNTLQARVLLAHQRGLDGSVPAPLPPGMRISGTSTLYDAQTGEARLQWVKAKAEEDRAALMEAIKDAFEEYKGHAVLPPPPTYSDDDLLALYPLADYHLGLYAWGEEAGQDWDVDKACNLLRRVLSDLINTTPPAKIAIILNLGDFMHADTMENRTMRSGNVLDVDTRYARVLSFGVQLLVEAVEMALQRHERVVVRNLRGNHDDHASIAITAALGAFFHDIDRVFIDASPSAHWSYRHGRTLLGATHGDTLKKHDQMAMWLANQSPQDWGKSRYRYFHHGHIHSATAKETGGVLVESHRTLAPRDAWAAAAGYLAGRAMSSITYHKRHGEQVRQTINIPHWND